MKLNCNFKIKFMVFRRLFVAADHGVGLLLQNISLNIDNK
jgi:putative addiction module killer protein/probable addiction module antidote protein